MDLNAQGLMFSIMILNAEKMLYSSFHSAELLTSLSHKRITGKARKLFHCSFLQVGSLMGKKKKKRQINKESHSFCSGKKKNREEISGFPCD